MYGLKQQPDDFFVEEQLSVEPQTVGKYLLLKVAKREKNTEDVAQLLSKKLGIVRKDIGYAGAKDRKAVTIQYFTVKGVKKERIASMTMPGVELTPVGFLNEPLTLGKLAGNTFRIVVRNLEPGATMKEPTCFINYFDEQRFSKQNAEIGRALVKKEFKVAAELLQEHENFEVTGNDYVGALTKLPRQILKIYLHAYQSLLWNRITAKYIAMLGESKKLSYSQGELFFPKETIESRRIPLPGFGVAYEGELVEFATEVLAEENITLRDFVVKQLPNLSLEGEERNLLINIANLSLSDPSPDELNPDKEQRLLRFTVPKGCYATMIVKQLFLS